MKNAAGTGEPELLLESAEDKFATDWSKDGGTLVFASRGPDTGWDLLGLPLAGEQGTVADSMNGTAADGRCRTKTGTLTGVSALWLGDYRF